MKENIIPAVRLTLVCLLLFSGIYTMIVWAVAQFAPNHGEGRIIAGFHGKYFYSDIGQQFSQDKYFWSRPSAVDYNAAAAGGSNKGPSNPDYLKTVQNRIDTFLVHNPGVKKEDIPAELVTASGSGLDPDISPAAAKVQVKRIAAVRKIDEQILLALVDKQTERPLLGLFGPSKVNVLKLNIALDELN